MIELRRVLCILGIAFAGMVGADAETNDGETLVTQPMHTWRCLVEGTFSCWEDESIYSVRGISCTEDCLALSRLNTCQLTNRCIWNPASGCFRKSVCVDVSSMSRCQRWEVEAICD